jgi:hypothetical protein
MNSILRPFISHLAMFRPGTGGGQRITHIGDHGGTAPKPQPGASHEFSSSPAGCLVAYLSVLQVYHIPGGLKMIGAAAHGPNKADHSTLKYTPDRIP